MADLTTYSGLEVAHSVRSPGLEVRIQYTSYQKLGYADLFTKENGSKSSTIMASKPKSSLWSSADSYEAEPSGNTFKSGYLRLPLCT